MSTSLKAKLFLLLVAVVWGSLIYSIWKFQLVVTLLGLLPYERLKELSKNIWTAQDNMVNVIVTFIVFGRAGNPDVTVSSKVGVLQKLENETADKMAKFINKGFEVANGQKDHCRESIEHDEVHVLGEWLKVSRHDG